MVIDAIDWETPMLRYIPGLIGALAAMVAFRLLGMLDFSVRILIFFAVYLLVTILVDKAMSRYGSNKP
jgi:membrane protein implicated in regulation of membrane protease activity